MAKSLVSLTMGEAKTSVNLSLEQKDTTTTFLETASDEWSEATRTWSQPGEFSEREQKTKVDLVLE